jgi:hypothetical protein
MVPTFAASLPGILATTEGIKRWTRSTRSRESRSLRDSSADVGRAFVRGRRLLSDGRDRCGIFHKTMIVAEAGSASSRRSAVDRFRKAAEAHVRGSNTRPGKRASHPPPRSTTGTGPSRTSASARSPRSSLARSASTGSRAPAGSNVRASRGRLLAGCDSPCGLLRGGR